MKYYYDDHSNAKLNLIVGLIIAFVCTAVFAISNIKRVDDFGIYYFILACMIVFFVISLIGVTTAFIAYFSNKTKSAKHRYIVDNGNLYNANITGVAYFHSKALLSAITGSTHSCELIITYNNKCFKTGGLKYTKTFTFLLENSEKLKAYPIPIRVYIKDNQIYADLTTARFDENHFNNTNNIMYEFINR